MIRTSNVVSPWNSSVGEALITRPLFHPKHYSDKCTDIFALVFIVRIRYRQGAYSDTQDIVTRLHDPSFPVPRGWPTGFTGTEYLICSWRLFPLPIIKLNVKVLCPCRPRFFGRGSRKNSQYITGPGPGLTGYAVNVNGKHCKSAFEAGGGPPPSWSSVPLLHQLALALIWRKMPALIKFTT